MKFLRGAGLPVLLTIAVTAASAAGIVILEGHQRAAAATVAKAAPVPVRGAAWTVDGAHDTPVMSEQTGTWITDAIVVRGGVDGLHAYQRTDGTPAWDLPVPTDGGAVCGMSATAGGGIGVVSFSTSSNIDASDCTTVEGIDLATGKPAWTSHTDGTRHAGTDDDVALMQSGTSKLVAVDLRSGTAKWTRVADAGCTEDSAGGFAVGSGVVLLIDKCGESAEVLALASADGHQLWKTPYSGAGSGSGSATGAIVSASPPILADDDYTPTQLTFYSASGAKIAQQPVKDTQLFATSAVQTAPESIATVGPSVVCGGGHSTSCWSTATGAPLRPQTGSGDVITVLATSSSSGSSSSSSSGSSSGSSSASSSSSASGSASGARVIALPAAAGGHASISRIGPDGKAVVEAVLAKSVTDFLVKQGAGSVQAFGDAHDLVLLALTPEGGTAVVDVR